MIMQEQCCKMSLGQPQCHDFFTVINSGDMRCVRVVPSYKMFSRSIALSFYPIDHQRGQSEEACSLFLLGTTSPVCHKNVEIIIARKCHDKVSDQGLGATKKVIKHVIGRPTG